MSDESHLLSSKAESDVRRDYVFSADSSVCNMKGVKDTFIHMATHNDWSVSMQIRLERLHTGKGKRWTKKRMPNPFFEISVLQEESTTAG